MASKALGEVLRQAREDAGLSLRDLARITGMPIGQLSGIETGARRDPGFSTMMRIVDGLGVSLDDIAAVVKGSLTTPHIAAQTKKRRKLIAAAKADLARLDKTLELLGMP